MPSSALLRTNSHATSMDGPTSIPIPGTVAPGEWMIAYVTRAAQLPAGAASTTTTMTMAGWSTLNVAVSGAAATTIATVVLTRKAVAGDAGSTVVFPNSAATGVMQMVHLTTWDTEGVYAVSPSGISSGNGTSITWVNPGTATQRVGDTLLLLGTLRNNVASGYNNVTMPSPVRLSGTVIFDTPFLPGVNTGQTAQAMAGFLIIPAAKAGSTLSGTCSITHTSRSTYVIELGPSLKKGVLTAQTRMAGSGFPSSFAQGRLQARTAVRALAQPKPPRHGTLAARAGLAGSGMQSLEAEGQGVLTARASLAGTGFAIEDIHSDIVARAGVAGSGFKTARASGALRARAGVAGRGVNAANIQVASAAGAMTATVDLKADGIQLSVSHTHEILYSARGYTTKGVTLAPGLTIVPAGTVIAIDRVDGYAYPFVFNGVDGRDHPIGVLRNTFIAGDYEEPANIIIAGNLRLDSLTKYAVRALVENRKASISIGRNLLRF